MEVFTNDTYNYALYADAFGRLDYDGFIKRVSRFKPYVIARLVKALDRSIRPINERHNRLSVFSRLARFDYNKIAVPYMLVYHRIAAHAKRERSASPEHIGRNRDRILAQNRFDRVTGGDIAQQRYLASLLGSLLLYKLEPARGMRYAPYQLLALKSRKQLVNSGRRAESKMRADISNRRRVPVRFHKAAKIIVDFTLTRR